MTGGATRYRVSRHVGRFVTRLAAILTFGRMPPFVSASAIVPDGGFVLVVMDSIRKEPVLPGGHVRWREDVRDAMVREVREETGYIVEAGGLVGVFSGRAWAGEEGVVRVIYEARLAGGSLTSSGEGESMWMNAEELAGTHCRDAPLVRMWLEGRIPSGAT